MTTLFVLLLIALSKIHTGNSSLCSNQDIKTKAQLLMYFGDDNAYHINNNALRLISNLSRPIKIITTIGSQRVGKSTALNEVSQQILDCRMQSKSEPFVVSSSYDPCTNGIWIYTINNRMQCGTNKCYQTENDMYSYILLDIEGSDSLNDDHAIRYAAVATLLSSHTFFFLQNKVKKHDVVHLKYMLDIIDLLNQQHINLNLNQLNFAAIVREPLLTQSIREKIENDLTQYLNGVRNSKYNDINLMDVISLPHYKDDSYLESIASIINFIIINDNQRSNLYQLAYDNIESFMNQLLEQLNDAALKQYDFSIIFSNLVKWLDWSVPSKCSLPCVSPTKQNVKGISEQHRTCNTGVDNDCIKLIGGSNVKQTICNDFLCKWDNHAWSPCSYKCNDGTNGGGYRIRTRVCNTHNNNDCEQIIGGKPIEQQRCNQNNRCNGAQCQFSNNHENCDWNGWGTLINNCRSHWCRKSVKGIFPRVEKARLDGIPQPKSGKYCVTGQVICNVKLSKYDYLFGGCPQRTEHCSADEEKIIFYYTDYWGDKCPKGKSNNRIHSTCVPKNVAQEYESWLYVETMRQKLKSYKNIVMS